MPDSLRCAECSVANPPNNKFCAGCGAALVAPQAAAPKVPLRWKWVGIGAAAVLVVQFGAGALIGLFSAQLQLESGSTMAAIIVASLVSYLVTGVIVAYVSPGVTLREPAIGAAAAVVVVNLVTGNFNSVVIGWAFPFFLTLVGAKLGERLQGREAA